MTLMSHPLSSCLSGGCRDIPVPNICSWVQVIHISNRPRQLQCSIFQPGAHCLCLRAARWHLLGRAPRQSEGSAVLEGGLRWEAEGWSSEADSGAPPISSLILDRPQCLFYLVPQEKNIVLWDCEYLSQAGSISLLPEIKRIYLAAAQEAVPICLRVHNSRGVGSPGPRPRLPQAAESHHLREDSWHAAQGRLALDNLMSWTVLFCRTWSTGWCTEEQPMLTVFSITIA